MTRAEKFLLGEQPTKRGLADERKFALAKKVTSVDQNGIVSSDKDDIKKVFVSYYVELFGGKDMPKDMMAINDLLSKINQDRISFRAGDLQFFQGFEGDVARARSPTRAPRVRQHTTPARTPHRGVQRWIAQDDLVFGSWVLGGVACKAIVYLQIVTLASTTFILTSMSYDRYMAICKPLESRSGLRRARCMVAASWAMAFVFATPQLFIFVQVQTGVTASGWPHLECLSVGYTHHWQRQLYFSWLTLYILVVPGLLISAFYLSLLRAVWAASDAIAATPAKDSGNGATTLRRCTRAEPLLSRARAKTLKLTVCIIASFVLCWIPYFAVHNVRIHSHYCIKVPRAVIVFAETLALLNSAVNPVFYGLFNAHIRRGLRDIIRTCRRRSDLRPERESTMRKGGNAFTTSTCALEASSGDCFPGQPLKTMGSIGGLEPSAAERSARSSLVLRAARPFLWTGLPNRMESATTKPPRTQAGDDDETEETGASHPGENLGLSDGTTPPKSDDPRHQQEGKDQFSWTDVVSRRARKRQLQLEREKASAAEINNYTVADKMTAAGNRPTGNMEPTGDARQGTGGSGVLCNQENRSRWKQTQALRQKRLPPLPVDDYKVVIRPRDGLNFSAWTTDKITQAIIAMAQLSAAEMAQATIRIRGDQNLVVVSTPNMESSTRVQQISALTLGTKQYEVTAYLAVPDNSCRGVISGVETRRTAEELTENLRATGINILYARMMGQTNTAVITFEGIRVPRFVYLSGGEYPCRPYQPRQQVCGVCLGLGHRTDVCPQPEQSRYTTCGAPGGAMEDHECTAHCVNCGGEHPATDPHCPARQRAPYNKEHVARYLREKEQQRAPPSPPPPLPYNALASHHWPELPSYNRVNPTPSSLLAWRRRNMIAAAQVLPRDSQATPKGTLRQKETATDATQATMPTRPKPSPRPDRGANRESVNSNDGRTSKTNQRSTPRSLDTRAQFQELTDVEDKPHVSTLVAKHIPVIVHTLSSPVPHVFLELLPQGRDDRVLFLLHVYSPPSRPRDVFDGLFRDAIHAARGKTDDLVMVGDFNATHPALGYAKATIKGRRLMDAIDVHRLTLLNEPDQPTRIGNSVSRDTCPDLTLARTHDECAWTNLGENLGSDHFILETRVPVALNRKWGRPRRLVNWDAFHQIRMTTPTADHTISDGDALDQWVQRLQVDVERVTKKVYATDKAPTIDPHLLHLWEARRGLTRKWRKKKHNRKLRARVAHLTQEAEEYAEELTQTNWNTLCDQLQGTLGSRRTWSLLRTLLDPFTSRIESSKAITKLLRSLPKSTTGDQLWTTLRDRYIAVGPRPAYAPYPHEDGSLNSKQKAPPVVSRNKTDDPEWTPEKRPGGRNIKKEPPPPVVLPDKRVIQKVGIRLRNLLKLPKAHRWVCYEWFYSNIDQPLFQGDNEFCAYLKQSFPLLKTRKLTRVQWCKIRRIMGKPRRCSPSFFEEEIRSLHERRNNIRQVQQRKVLTADNFSNLPADIPLPLVIGTKVTARLRKPQDGLFEGSIDAVDTQTATYRTKFDRSGLGTHSVPDYEVLSIDPPETMPKASFLQRQRPRHIFYVTPPRPIPYTQGARLENDPLLGGSPLRPGLSGGDETSTVGGFPVDFLTLMRRRRRAENGTVQEQRSVRTSGDGAAGGGYMYR
ncbi:hypothetical protein HPB47_024662 [Ixodes persulcatus]|uniref:Uncharacterized protein n=1 Tax=Ixodes persulcatus TaxID=34615 RepID=A0AC60Q3R8_IXOPE|nr:hypothetical protein HPB47_024662 [Ixodes persulcatus]